MVVTRAWTAKCGQSKNEVLCVSPTSMFAAGYNRDHFLDFHRRVGVTVTFRVCTLEVTGSTPGHATYIQSPAGLSRLNDSKRPF